MASSFAVSQSEEVAHENFSNFLMVKIQWKEAVNMNVSPLVVWGPVLNRKSKFSMPSGLNIRISLSS